MVFIAGTVLHKCDENVTFGYGSPTYIAKENAESLTLGPGSMEEWNVLNASYSQACNMQREGSISKRKYPQSWTGDRGQN